MLNDPFRSSLTRDEIIGILLGWIKGPVRLYSHENEELSAEEEEFLESWSYSVYEDRENREADALEKRMDYRESGQSEEICRKPIEDFKREDEAFKRFCDEVDDEISKGANSMLRVDPRNSTARDTCYTRKSFDDWVRARPDLSASIPSSSEDSAPSQSRSELQDEAILACFKDLGYNATSLEPIKPGRKGIKRQIRDMLVGKEPLPTSKTFDNVWQRLRDANKIREVTQSPTTALPKKTL